MCPPCKPGGEPALFVDGGELFESEFVGVDNRGAAVFEVALQLFEEVLRFGLRLRLTPQVPPLAKLIEIGDPGLPNALCFKKLDAAGALSGHDLSSSPH